MAMRFISDIKFTETCFQNEKLYPSKFHNVQVTLKVEASAKNGL